MEAKVIPFSKIQYFQFANNIIGNLSDIFDGERYVGSASSRQTKLIELTDDVEEVAGELAHDAEVMLNKFEEMVMDDLKATFEKAKEAIAHNA